jgi:hypothetical protein
MADEQNSPHRVNLASDRTTQAAQGQNDPLAELARLIGQNDPFSEFGRAASTAAPQTPPGSAPGREPHQPPYAEARDHPFTAAPPSQHYHEPPAFIRAAQEGDPYPDAIYRDTTEPPPSSAHYDDLDESRRGRGVRTAGAVIALVLIGTVAAFGYRFIFGGSGPSTPPPVIRANPEPAKVPPPTGSADAQGKSTYERVGDRAQGERIVSREEAPVDLKDVVRPGAGRSPPQQQSPTSQWTSATTAPSSTTAPSAMGEPKKVRTVTIRPNATDSNGAPSSLTPPTAAAAPAPSSAPSRSAPTQLSAPAQQPAVQQQQASAQPKPPAVAAIQSGVPPANAPLSLNEDSVLTLPRSLDEPRTAPPPRLAQAQRQPPQRNAAVAAAAPPPQPLAQAPAKGGYLVQVSSQRSEADAQAALRTLQAKYPNVLGGQPITIRRADLGERGVFFRAAIGPYASREQANQLCSSLKAAGGDCFVHGN